MTTDKKKFTPKWKAMPVKDWVEVSDLMYEALKVIQGLTDNEAILKQAREAILAAEGKE